MRGQCLGDQLREPVEPESFRLDPIEQTREFGGETGDARRILRFAFPGPDQLGKQELTAERRDRRRQIERRGRGHVVGLEFLVGPDIADRQDGGKQQRPLRARAQHRLAERPACPPVGEQHRRAGECVPRLLRQDAAGENVEKGHPGGDREDARRRRRSDRHPTWKS